MNSLLHNSEVLEIIKAYPNLTPSQFENLFLRKIDDETILETLIKMNADIVSPTFDKEESLRIILKNKRYDLLKYVTPRNFLRYKRKNLTYLEYVLRLHKHHPEINISFYDIFKNTSSQKEIADFYIIYARNNLEKNLPKITESMLKYREDSFISKVLKRNDNLLGVMLKRSNDRQLIINKYVPKGTTKDAEIILTTNELNNYRAKLDIKGYLSDIYMDSYYDMHDELYTKLSYEDKKLIIKLSDVLEKVCDSNSKTVVLNSYVEQLNNNTPFVREELEKFMNILEEEKNFIIKMGNESYYYRGHNELSIADGIVNTFNHELGHMLLDKLHGNSMLYGMDEIIAKIKKDPSSMNKISTISKIFKSLISKIIFESKKYLEDTYSIDDKVIMRYLNNQKNIVIEEYSKKGYSKSKIEELIKRDFTKERYIDQYRRTQINKLSNTIGKLKIDPMLCISDMIDAIYDGEYFSNDLKDKNGQILKSIGGHGEYYYKSSKSTKYDEIFANYIALRKCVDYEWLSLNYSSNIKNPMDLLREVFGNEFVDFLDKFYEREIINSNRYCKGEMIK